MKTKSSTIGVLLLMSILLMSAPQIMGIKEAKAYNYSLIFAPNYFIQGLDDEYEATTTNYATDYIQQIFRLYGQNYAYDTVIRVTDATCSNYNDYAQQAMSADQVAFFSKGHTSSENYTGHTKEHHYLMDHNGAREHDYNYDDYTSAGKHKFVFIWHCGTTEDYVTGGNMLCSCGSYSSMPMAWTRDSQMNINGYTYPSGTHVFVGHQGWSPQFRSNNELVPAGSMYSDFAKCIYDFLLHDQDNIKLALQKACYMYYGGNSDFPSTWIGREKVNWDPDGNGTITCCYQPHASCRQQRYEITRILEE